VNPDHGIACARVDPPNQLPVATEHRARLSHWRTPTALTRGTCVRSEMELHGSQKAYQLRHLRLHRAVSLAIQLLNPRLDPIFRLTLMFGFHSSSYCFKRYSISGSPENAARGKNIDMHSERVLGAKLNCAQGHCCCARRGSCPMTCYDVSDLGSVHPQCI
jgi:hypothetical protein